MRKRRKRQKLKKPFFRGRVVKKFARNPEKNDGELPGEPVPDFVVHRIKKREQDMKDSKFQNDYHELRLKGL